MSFFKAAVALVAADNAGTALVEGIDQDAVKGVVEEDMVQGVGQAVVGEVAHGEVEGARVQLELHPG